MAYFYDNNVRKIPGPSYLFDYIYKVEKLPSDLDLTKSAAANGLNSTAYNALKAVEIGRYILFDPPAEGAFAGYIGTAWQKVVNGDDAKAKVTFALVADKYTNPVEGLTAAEMKRIWDHVWGEDDV